MHSHANFSPTQESIGLCKLARVYYYKDKLEPGLIYVSKSKSFTNFSILNISNESQHGLCRTGLGCRRTSVMINREIVKSEICSHHPTPWAYGAEAPGLLLFEVGQYF